MPRSRSRSPRRRDGSHERRHRSRRYGDEPRDDDRRRRDREPGRSSRREREPRRSSRDREQGPRRSSRDKEREPGRSSRDQEREAHRSSREKSYREDDTRGSDKGDERIARRENPRARLQAQIGQIPSRFATGANAGPGGEAEAAAAPVEKEAPNFAPTGLLAAATNTVNGVVLKYSEPAEARKPPANQRWRLFVFKDKEIVDTVDLNANSCWLVGRDRAVADLPVDHPSCSKQHAVLQFRYVVKTGEFGDKESGVKPYVMDLESANGTTVGKVEVPGGRYLELKEGDLIMFGLSTREYILMLDKN